jgi:ferredoxin-NADP reductase
MLTEPLTTPPTKKIKIIYGALIGLLFGLHFHFGKIYSTPELALIIGNLFGYLFILKQRINLTLLKKEEIAENIFELTFKPNRPLKFKAGQYLEFTLSHPKPDSRGERRYFTIASAPEETELKIGIKATERGSSFKQTLLNLKNGERVVASNLDGDFILPKNPNQKICLIAGGIGVTPFRSMIQSLVNQANSNEVVLFYNVKTVNEIAYQDLFESAKQKIKLIVVYVISDKNPNPNWSGEVGFMDQKMVEKYLKNPKDYQFYLSGPNAMVNNYQKMIGQMKVPANQIKTDYFPGF